MPAVQAPLRYMSPQLAHSGCSRQRGQMPAMEAKADGRGTCRAEVVCSAPMGHTSTYSAISSASSTPIPRYRAVLSILVWPSSS
jgi:hypothetical protein